jgi:hypothetical protein
MRKTLWKSAVLFAAISSCLVGCDSNPTNAPSDEAIQQANVKRAAAIDNNPKYSPEQKATLKKMLHLDGSAPVKKQ